MLVELPDLETVLAPLEGGIGTPLADDDFSSPLVQFRQDCRSAARYEKADDEEEQEKAEKKWAEAAERGIAILANQWKNLDVAALLIQALVRTNGVAGLHFGYRIVSGLLRRYWDDLSRSWGEDYSGAQDVERLEFHRVGPPAPPGGSPNRPAAPCCSISIW